CNRCPGVPLKTAPKLLLHNAAHILTDNELASRSPCGFCLRTNNECYIFLHSKSPEGIDLSRSVCKNLMKVQLSSAKKFSKSSPCTNVPVRCPYCGPSEEAVWRYNLRQHFELRHPNYSPELNPNIWEIDSQERSAV
ncbi:hypothetical protein BDV93DRAFT_407538, partial [Ceratobasidium sp. AG-I]